MVHDDSRKDRDPSAVEYAIDKRKRGKRPDVGRNGPGGQSQRHADKHHDERGGAPHPIRQAAEKETSTGTSDPDHAYEDHGGRRRDAVIQRVGNGVNERQEHAERAQQTRPTSTSGRPHRGRRTAAMRSPRAASLRPAASIARPTA